MKYLKRILSLMLAIVTINLVIIPTYAEEYTSTPSFWEWQLIHAWQTGLNYFGMPYQLTNWTSSALFDDYCTSSPDGLHHCTSEDLKLGDLSDNNLGVTACMGTCEYCGEEFLVTGDDLGAAYQQTIEDMQSELGTTIVTDNGLIYAFVPTSISGSYVTNKVIDGAVFSASLSNYEYSRTADISFNSVYVVCQQLIRQKI